MMEGVILVWTWERWWSKEGEARRRKMQGGKREDSEEIEFGFWIWEENWEREEREQCPKVHNS